MKRNIIFSALVLICLNSLFAQQQQLDRSKPPAPGPAPEIRLSDYESFELPNGLKVFVVENHQLPLVSFSLIVDRDPIMEKDAAGYVDMAGDLLRTGTKTRTKAQIDEQIDFIGATLNTASNSVFASSLKKHLDVLLDLMADVVINPVFKQEELDRLKTKTMSSLAASKDEPETIVERIVQTLYYGKDHPYSEFETEKTVGNISIEMCRNYYDSFFKPNISYLAVVGDVTKGEIQPLIEKYFSSWRKAEVKHFTYPQPQPPASNKVAIVDRPTAVQSTLRIGYPVDLKVGSEDVIKSSVANTILGGGVFRLFKNLREKHSFTYGAYSSLHPDKYIGNFTASTNVRNSATDSAISEILYEMKRIDNERPEENELQQAKNYSSGNFALSLERPETIARFAINIERYNLPKDYYSNYLKNVARVSTDDVMSMSKKYIHPDNTYIIAVGNASEVADKLKKFNAAGELEYYDIYGEKYNPNAASVPAGVDAQTVISKYIDALGGRDNMQKVTDRTTLMTGNIQGRPVNINIYQKRPNKLTQEVSVGGQQMQKIVFNGQKAVQISPVGRQDLAGQQLEDLKLEANFNSILDLNKYGITAKLAGMEKLDGKDAYKLEMTNQAGKKWFEYYEAGTGLKLRQVKTVASQMGNVTQTIDFSDYRDIDGVKYPFSISQTLGQQKVDMKVDSIKVNSNLSDNLFNTDKQ